VHANPCSSVGTRFDDVLGMTLNCIHIFIVTGSLLYGCVMRPASQRFFMHSCILFVCLLLGGASALFGPLVPRVCSTSTVLGTSSLSGADVPLSSKQTNKIYLRILIISYLATFLGTNGLSVLICRKAVNQYINEVRWHLAAHRHLVASWCYDVHTSHNPLRPASGRL